MNRLISARKNLRKNSKKGFTLVELIVVIVIIAILIAALTPAILGVIERANETADKAEARSIMMAASVWALNSTTPPVTPLNATQIAEILAEMDGAAGIKASGITDLKFSGFVCISVTYQNRAANPVTVPEPVVEPPTT